MAHFYGLTIVAIGRAAAIVRAKIERRQAPGKPRKEQASMFTTPAFAQGSLFGGAGGEGGMESAAYQPFQPPEMPAWRAQWRIWRAAKSLERIGR